MRTFGQSFLVLLFSLVSFAAEQSPPESFAKTSFSYSLLSWVVDLDATIKDLGINVQACQLENSATPISYSGLGQCLFESIKYTFKEKKPSTILIWIVDVDHKVLPPLKLEWKNSHTGFWKLSNEFLFIAFEGVFSKFVRKENNHVTNKANGSCKIQNVPNKDLGNFIGDMAIYIPKGHTLSQYLNMPLLQGVRTEKVNLSAQVPFHLNKKRAYKAKLSYTNEGAESVELAVLTNINIVKQRDFCVSGKFQVQQGSTPNMVTP